MDVLKITIVAILIVFLVVNMIGLQIAAIFYRFFLDYNFYEKIAIEQEFYAQIRQLMFRLIRRSLPNALEGLPYIESALTEFWLKSELDILISEFLAFTKGQRLEPPIIPIYSLKEKVMQSLDDSKTLSEKERMVDYWFSPLPDKIRLQDFISYDAILNIKFLATLIYRVLWGLIGTLIILVILIYLVERNWKTMLLWVSTATAASGIHMIFIGFGIRLLFEHSSYIINFYNNLVAFEIPEETVKNLIDAFKIGFTKPLILAGMIIAVIAGIIIYFLPIQKRSLTLIK